MSRTKNSIKNLSISTVGQIVTLLCNFVARKVFIVTLGEEYLGLNSVFSNLLSMLSLAELGAGTAIAFALYQPLARGNREEIKSIMLLFKRVYWTIGAIIAVLGVGMTPFLGFFVESTEIQNISVLFLLYVTNSAISYFFSYKGTLIDADQKKYIVALNRNVFKVVLDIVQCSVLLWKRNFILYLVVQICVTVLSNVTLSMKADKLYPYLRDKQVEPLGKDTLQQIVKNTAAMVFHKLGNVLVNATDSLIISKFVNILVAGFYSNYTMIFNAVMNFESLIYQSITASVGSFNVTETDERKQELFSLVNFTNYVTTGFCTVCLWILFNPFIAAWAGERMLLGTVEVGLICIRYYCNGMRKSVLTFRDAMGLYWHDRYKSIVESVINLVASILLAHKLGITGVLLGTLISFFATCFWVEPYVLYKHGLHKSVGQYFRQYAVSCFKIILTVIVLTLCMSKIEIQIGYLQVLIKALLTTAGYAIITFALNFYHPQFKHLMKIVVRMLHRKER